MKIERHYIDAEYARGFFANCKYPVKFYRHRGKISFDFVDDLGHAIRFTKAEGRFNHKRFYANRSDVIRVEVEIPEWEDGLRGDEGSEGA